LNCYPFFCGLEKRGVLFRGRLSLGQGGTRVELVSGVPTELNRMLVEGETDVGPISSIAYARAHRELLISRHLSVSCFGAVDSIQLVAKRPLEQIESVALTGQSATSVVLLKTILRLHLKREVVYTALEGDIAAGLAEADAVLLIGDQGLDALYFPTPGTTCHDLGAIWQEWTGLPMVYAVWAVRENFARARSADLLAVENELVRCMDYARKHQTEVVEGALGRSRLDRKGLARYYAILRYDFPPLYQEGLRRFYELAHEAGELEEVPQLRFFDEVVGG
jgi:chorismate dehydratase